MLGRIDPAAPNRYVIVPRLTARRGRHAPETPGKSIFAPSQSDSAPSTTVTRRPTVILSGAVASSRARGRAPRTPLINHSLIAHVMGWGAPPRFSELCPAGGPRATPPSQRSGPFGRPFGVLGRPGDCGLG